MRKINNSNNKFRNNAIYSLNYKFDSVSSAGKFSGTALELIKKYNELAKEAQSNGNYVEMEVFRQYAEHYRKIVTEINERKNQYRENQNETENTAENADSAPQSEAQPADNGLVETESAEQPASAENKTSSEDISEKKVRRRRNFTIIEVSENASENASDETAQNAEKPRRRILGRKPRISKNTTENAVSEES
ncbi:MAG: DUF4167 domain-containing protein [Alphaproteobacteria bacterium]|nr:DUF4167 domain-containing protein [Alphaproteobacteria bacterium]